MAAQDSRPAVLVTGGAGYIGSHTAKALDRAGFMPVVLDNLSRGHDWAVRFGPLVKADVGNGHAVREAIRAHRIDRILHFAAFAYVGESVKQPDVYFENNVSQMEALLTVAASEGVKEFVFSSSCATYGQPEAIPVTEQEPQKPVSPYGDTKLIGERMLSWYSGAFGIRFAALRYFNASGADPDSELGEVHDPETHLLPNIIKAALGKKTELEVYGSDYPTRDGTAVRDYIHVTDLADAHVRAVKHLADGGETVRVNLGSGTGHSIMEAISCVERVSGRSVPRRMLPRREGDPAELYANNSLAREVLGWVPSHSDLDTICKTAFAWESRN